MESYHKSSYLAKRVNRLYQVKLLDGSYSTNSSSHAYLTTGGVLDGYKNPYYRRQIKKHTQAGTDLVASRTRIDMKAHDIMEKYHQSNPLPTRIDFNYSWGDQYTWNPYPAIDAGPLVTKANNRALTKFVSKADDARQVLQSGEMIGEFAELTRLVKRPAQGLRTQINGYVETVKRRFTSRKSRLLYTRRPDQQVRDLADTWLEYAFGIKPTISELNDVKDYIMGKADKGQYLDVTNIKASAVERDSAWGPNGTTRLQATWGNPGVKFRQRDRALAVVTYRGDVGMSNEYASSAVAEKIGFHPTQWIPTVWELIPYSFLIDYFTNVGDMIYGWSFPRGSVRWILKTIYTEVEGKFVDPEFVWHEPQVTNRRTIERIVYSPGAASIKLSTVSRSPYTGSLVPDWEFQIPTSGTKLLNLTALFARTQKIQKLLRQP